MFDPILFVFVAVTFLTMPGNAQPLNLIGRLALQVAAVLTAFAQEIL